MTILAPFVALFVITVIIFYLLSLDKLIKSIRTKDNSRTYINRVWVWTQLIPIWAVVAIIVYHIKMIDAIKALEIDLNLPNNTIKYPEIIGWFFTLAFLYSWIPVVGVIFGASIWILYWIKIVLTSEQILKLKNSRGEIN